MRNPLFSPQQNSFYFGQLLIMACLIYCKIALVKLRQLQLLQRMPYEYHRSKFQGCRDANDSNHGFVGRVIWRQHH